MNTTDTAYTGGRGEASDAPLLVEDVLRLWAWWPCFLVQAMDEFRPGFFPSLQGEPAARKP
jgi:hypothetical protein